MVLQQGKRGLFLLDTTVFMIDRIQKMYPRRRAASVGIQNTCNRHRAMSRRVADVCNESGRTTKERNSREVELNGDRENNQERRKKDQEPGKKYKTSCGVQDASLCASERLLCASEIA